MLSCHFFKFDIFSFTKRGKNSDSTFLLFNIFSYYPFKTWMCGGQLEIIPCSHVGHIYRSRSPYQRPGDTGATLRRNLARLAAVWLDQYQQVINCKTNQC